MKSYHVIILKSPRERQTKLAEKNFLEKLLTKS